MTGLAVLRREVSAWDGRAVEPIQAVYAARRGRERFASDVLRLAREPACEVGATWLLKRGLEDDLALSVAQTTRALALLSQVRAWEARLHVLQSLPYLVIPARAADSLEANLARDVESEAKFVRAWAYSGYADLARQHGRFAERARAMLRAAGRDPAASVRARVRRIRTDGWD